MDKKNVVLLGGSNSVMVNGLQRGLREGINKISNHKKDLKFYNFAIGGCTAIQNLYEIIRHKEIVNSANLIITESNVNEIHNHGLTPEKLSLKLIYRQLSWFYKELFALKKRVLIIILPEYCVENRNIHILINNLHKKFANKYGFNIIDIQNYYNIKNLKEFGKRYDGGGHSFDFIMRNLGINIIKNIDYFQLSKFIDYKNDNPKFEICTPVDMKLIEGNLRSIHINNSVYDEKIYRINNTTKLKFPDSLNQYILLAFHSWNNKEGWKENFNIPQNWNQCIKTYSSIII
ncbi:hypothetical protein ABZN45_01835 [Campylobacter sp. MRC_CM3]